MQTFVTLDGITTSAGYPLQIAGGTRIHLRTLLIFRYRADNELCSAAKATTRRRRRQVPDVGGPLGRRRRQATLDGNKMSQELVDTILADEDKLVDVLLQCCQTFHGSVLITC